MKLPSVTHGPVSLSKIDYAPNLSEETVAFTAVVTIDGKSAPVRNDGRGGNNLVQIREVDDLIEAYAKTLPDDQTQYGPLSFNGDYLIATMIEMAISQAEDAKMKRKGYTHVAVGAGRKLYARGASAPVFETLVKTVGKEAALLMRIKTL